MASEQTIEHILVSRGFLSEAQMANVRHAMEQLGGTYGEIILTMDLLSVEEYHKVQQLADALEQEHEAGASSGGPDEADAAFPEKDEPYMAVLPKLPAAAPSLPKLPDLPDLADDLSLGLDDPLDGLGLPLVGVESKQVEETAVGPPPSPDEFAPAIEDTRPTEKAPASPEAASGAVPMGLPRLPPQDAAPEGGELLEATDSPAPAMTGLPPLPLAEEPPERVKQMMQALEEVEFDESLAETMAPGLGEPSEHNTSPDASAQLRAQVEGDEEVAASDPATAPTPAPETKAPPEGPRTGLTDSGHCRTCDKAYPDTSNVPMLCSSCRAFLRRPPSKDRLIGQRLGGRFFLNGRLGAGGMGLVYHATDLETDAFVACKILPIQLSTDENTIKRFNLEARVMLELEHPNIVRAIDFGFEEDLGCYLAMELLVGEEFKDCLREQGTLSPHEVIEVFSQICDAMAYAHDKGVVHRDLKPSNVFLMESQDGPFGHVKVIDFGIARLTAEDMPRHTVTGTFLGTPQYMSPEQASAKSDLDHRSDVYSLGVMLFEVLVGRLPFVGEHIAQVLMHQIYMQPPTLVELRPEQAFPELLQPFLNEVLAKEPDGRPTSMHKFKEGLLRALAGSQDEEWGKAEVTVTIDDPMVSEQLLKAANELLASHRRPPLHSELTPEQIFDQLAAQLRIPDVATASVGEVAVLMLSEEVIEEEDELPPAPEPEPTPKTTGGAVIGQVKPIAVPAEEAGPTRKSTGSLPALKSPKKAPATASRQANASVRAAEAAFVQSQKRKFLFMLIFATLFFGLLVVALWVAK